MQISRPALASHGFWIILAIAFCISIGILIGLHGGLHNEAGAIYDSRHPGSDSSCHACSFCGRDFSTAPETPSPCPAIKGLTKLGD